MLLCDKICNLQKWNDWFLPAIKAFQINTMELMSVIKRFLMWSSHMTMYISKLIILWKEKEECFSMQHPFLLGFFCTSDTPWNEICTVLSIPRRKDSKPRPCPAPARSNILTSNLCQNLSSGFWHPSIHQLFQGYKPFSLK